MKIEEFEKLIRDLPQEAVVKYALTALNTLLVKKGIITDDVLQKTFLMAMEGKL